MNSTNLGRSLKGGRDAGGKREAANNQDQGKVHRAEWGRAAHRD